MKLIFKYLKPYLLVVAAVVALTFIQVQTELTLPDYMSSIVTDGIQYGGISEEAPLVLTAEDMELIQRFMSDDDKAVIRKQYQLISAGATAVVDHEQIRFESDVWLLKDSDEKLVSIMKEPLVYTYMAKLNDIDLNQENDVLKAQIAKDLEGLEDNYVSMVRLYIRDLYKNVGMSVENIQTDYILSAGLKMLGIAAIGVAVQLLSTYLSTKTAARVAAKMRKDVFEKVESFSSS